VRALVHDPAKQDRVRDAGADQAVLADLRDPAGMRAALDGVDGVFLIIPAFAPGSAALGTWVVAAGQAAGVWRLVLCGVYHPSLSLVTRSELAALMTGMPAGRLPRKTATPPSPCAACPMRPRGTACSQCSPTTPPTGSTAATAWLSALGRTPRSLNDFFAELAR